MAPDQTAAAEQASTAAAEDMVAVSASRSARSAQTTRARHGDHLADHDVPTQTGSLARAIETAGNGRPGGPCVPQVPLVAGPDVCVQPWRQVALDLQIDPQKLGIAAATYVLDRLGHPLHAHPESDPLHARQVGQPVRGRIVGQQQALPEKSCA